MADPVIAHFLVPPSRRRHFELTVTRYVATIQIAAQWATVFSKLKLKHPIVAELVLNFGCNAPVKLAHSICQTPPRNVSISSSSHLVS